MFGHLGISFASLLKLSLIFSFAYGEKWPNKVSCKILDFSFANLHEEQSGVSSAHFLQEKELRKLAEQINLNIYQSVKSKYEMKTAI